MMDARAVCGKNAVGTFPFGSPVLRLVQEDRRPKRVFVLGVYASAVHARWVGPDGKERVKALAVASEPTIFWDGSGASEIIRHIALPTAVGRLEAAEPKLNGASGRSLDEDFLDPLRVGRPDAWLCDLVPYSCSNEQQRDAIQRAYDPVKEAWGLPAISVPAVPPSFADDARRAEVLVEVEEAQPEVIVLLGDQPIRHWLAAYVARRRRLSDFGKTPETYGRLHPMVINEKKYRVLPLAHPRQVGGLGTHSAMWRELHRNWRALVAPGLL
jgi:hypothetical protein